MAQKKQVEEADPHVDGIPMGVTWEQDEPGAPPGAATPTEELPEAFPLDADDTPTEENPRSEDGSPRGAPEAEGRLLPAEEPDDAVTPKKALLQDVNTRLGAALSAWHTYALLACHKRWATIEAYVQDPDLYREVCEAEQSEIRRERAAVAKRLHKATIRKDAAQVKILTEELEELERRAPSAMKMDALTLKARGGRLARQLTVPAMVAFGPLAGAIGAGWWWALLAYPIAWGWLAAQGHAMAVADGTVTVSEEPAEKARELAGNTSDPGVAPRVAAPTVPAVVVGATEAENLILGHLAEWGTRSAGRGLEGVAPGAPTVDALGVRVVLTTSGKVTPESLGKKLPALRAALSVPRNTRSDLGEGDYGDQGVLRIRTRTPSRDMTWRPGCKGVGLDTDTGQPVTLPKGRKLIAGTSGAGKSVLVRVRIAEALQATEPTVVVYIDAKGEEAGLWRGKIRTATEVHEILRLLSELNREAEDRMRIMQDQGVATWVPTPEHPRIVAVVDEGAELVAMHDMSPKDEEDRIDILGLIGPLGRTGRSRAIDVEWATQKPTLGEGIPSQLNGVMQDRIVLRTAGRNENNQVLSSDWKTHELELGGSAVTNIAGRGPLQAPIQVWDLSDDAAVASVPGGRVWSYSPDPQAPEEAQETVEPEGRFPRSLGAAMALLNLLEGANGLTGVEIAQAAEMTLPDAQAELKSLGVEPDRFMNGGGKQVRGYRREDLEEAAVRYSA